MVERVLVTPDGVVASAPEVESATDQVNAEPGVAGFVTLTCAASWTAKLLLLVTVAAMVAPLSPGMSRMSPLAPLAGLTVTFVDLEEVARGVRSLREVADPTMPPAVRTSAMMARAGHFWKDPFAAPTAPPARAWRRAASRAARHRQQGAAREHDHGQDLQ